MGNLSAVILCAGKGERLRPLTLTIPKCLVPIDGVPLLGKIVEWLGGHGIHELHVNRHYLPEKITDYLGDGAAFGASVDYSFEPELLGSAGALWAFEQALSQDFYVVYGDIYTNVDPNRLRDAHYATGADATMLVSRVPNPTECGLVDFDGDGRVRRLVEKPPAEEVFTDWANGGVYVVSKRVFDLIPRGREWDFGRDVFPAMIRDGLLITAVLLEDDEFLIDIGSPEKLASAQGIG